MEPITRCIECGGKASVSFPTANHRVEVCLECGRRSHWRICLRCGEVNGPRRVICLECGAPFERPGSIVLRERGQGKPQASPRSIAG